MLPLAEILDSKGLGLGAGVTTAGKRSSSIVATIYRVKGRFCSSLHVFLPSSYHIKLPILVTFTGNHSTSLGLR